MKKTFPFLFVIILLSSSCINNVEDLSEPVPDPDPEDVSYASDVQPIFDAHCTNCHGNSNRSGNISFATYEGTTSESGTNYGASLINAGDADASGLVDK